ncbi:unnamed protein product [Tuber aestivum]|uniref:Uncharacterized protein n=1 Tax=Tuber aestivum TaxID=59557 RepID=A0A292PNI4_9PEZI|nr:unnamed protein product [Tuber aestivum]
MIRRSLPFKPLSPVRVVGGSANEAALDPVGSKYFKIELITSPDESLSFFCFCFCSPKHGKDERTDRRKGDDTRTRVPYCTRTVQGCGRTQQAKLPSQVS